MQPQAFNFLSDAVPEIVVGAFVCGAFFWTIRHLEARIDRVDERLAGLKQGMDERLAGLMGEIAASEKRIMGDEDGLTLAGLKKEIAASEGRTEKTISGLRGGDGDNLTLAGVKEGIAASEVRTEKAIQRVEQQTASLGQELRGDIRALGKELNAVEVRLSVKVGRLEVGYAAPQVRERAVDDD